MSFIQPDRYFSRISHVDIARDLLGCGLTNVLVDIDNTLRSRETGGMPRDVGVWLGQARDAGVQFCVLSNNWHTNAYEFAGELGLPVVAKACKPLPHGYLLAMKKLGARRANTVVIGDQLSTDIVGAHVLGLQAYLVAPLAEQDLKHTMVVRQFERALLGDRVPEGATTCKDSR